MPVFRRFEYWLLGRKTYSHVRHKYHEYREGKIMAENEKLGSAEAYFNRGVRHYNKGDFESALADFTEAIRLDPNDPDSYRNRGIVYTVSGENDLAIADYDQAIRLAPNSADLYFQRADSNKAAGYHEKAIADYQKGLQLSPNTKEAYVGIGLAYFSLNYDLAIENFTKAISLDQNMSEVYCYRGQTYYFKRDYDSAITDFETVLQLDPSNAEAKEKLKSSYAERQKKLASDEHIQRGKTYYGEEKYDLAIEEFTKALKSGSNVSMIYCFRGLAYKARWEAEKSKFDCDRAIADFTMSIDLSPTAFAHCERGTLYGYKNDSDSDKALAEYEMAIRLDPNYAEAYRLRGIYYGAREDFVRAKADFQTVLRLDPDNVFAKTILAKIG